MTNYELPPPDTHCFDDDTGKDVWSYSKELVLEILEFELKLVSAQAKHIAELKAKLPPTGHVARKRIREGGSMTTNYERTAAWLKACGKEPSNENFSVQIGCHMEEFVELLRSVELYIFDDRPIPAAFDHWVKDVSAIARSLKCGISRMRIKDREAFLDALCDCEVTGNGLAYLAQMNKPAADAAVLAANEAKLVDGKPVILPGGKIGKPEGWTPPDLSKFV